MGEYRFLPYEPEKPLLLPPDMRTWLPDDHLAVFISDLVDSLDLSGIIAKSPIELAQHELWKPSVHHQSPCWWLRKH